ncbi:WD40 repeat domain-containing protein [Streptomyces antimycoticus]|nr:WD40 repeat domain-containing protein [Streptomyces antimycoticus]
MGRVYLGRTPAGSAVAVKVVHREYAGDATFSPDGKLLATGSQAGPVNLFDTGSRKDEILASYDQEASGTGVAFSPDGRLIAGNDTKHHKVYLWKNPKESVR